MSEVAFEITDETFRSLVLESSTPVVVDFWAPWCAPCRKVAPILDELATEYQGKISVGKINADDAANTKTVGDAGISSIPTINVYVGGKIVKQIIGAKAKPELLKELEDLITPPSPRLTGPKGNQ
jgi:thioredoxin 1